MSLKPEHLEEMTSHALNKTTINELKMMYDIPVTTVVANSNLWVELEEVTCHLEADNTARAVPGGGPQGHAPLTVYKVIQT